MRTDRVLTISRSSDGPQPPAWGDHANGNRRLLMEKSSVGEFKKIVNKSTILVGSGVGSKSAEKTVCKIAKVGVGRSNRLARSIIRHM